MATKQKGGNKMEKQKGSGIAIIACIIAATLACGGLGVYFLTGEEFSAPTLISPSDGSGATDNTPTFEWEKVPNAENYRLLVDNDPDFSSPEVDVTVGAGEDSYTVPDENALPYSSYYWKVIAIRRADEGNASDDGVSRSVERESETWKNNVKEAVAPYP